MPAPADQCRPSHPIPCRGLAQPIRDGGLAQPIGSRGLASSSLEHGLYIWPIFPIVKIDWIDLIERLVKLVSLCFRLHCEPCALASRSRASGALPRRWPSLYASGNLGWWLAFTPRVIGISFRPLILSYRAFIPNTSPVGEPRRFSPDRKSVV